MRKLSLINDVCKKCGSLNTPGELCGCEDGLYPQNLMMESKAFLTDYLSRLGGLDSLPVEIRYGRMKNADYNPDNSIGSAEIRVLAIFRSPSGFMVRGEVPILIREGKFISPSVIYFGELPEVISSTVINSRLRAGTSTKPFLPRRMLDPPLDPEVRLMYEEMPKEDKIVVEQRRTMFDPPKGRDTYRKKLI